jgi:hypothetical protein
LLIFIMMMMQLTFAFSVLVAVILRRSGSRSGRIDSESDRSHDCADRDQPERSTSNEADHEATNSDNEMDKVDRVDKVDKGRRKLIIVNGESNSIHPNADQDEEEDGEEELDQVRLRVAMMIGQFFATPALTFTLFLLGTMSPAFLGGSIAVYQYIKMIQLFRFPSSPPSSFRRFLAAISIPLLFGLHFVGLYRHYYSRRPFLDFPFSTWIMNTIIWSTASCLYFHRKYDRTKTPVIPTLLKPTPTQPHPLHPPSSSTSAVGPFSFATSLFRFLGDFDFSLLCVTLLPFTLAFVEFSYLLHSLRASGHHPYVYSNGYIYTDPHTPLILFTIQSAEFIIVMAWAHRWATNRNRAVESDEHQPDQVNQGDGEVNHGKTRANWWWRSFAMSSSAILYLFTYYIFSFPPQFSELKTLPALGLSVVAIILSNAMCWGTTGRSGVSECWMFITKRSRIVYIGVKSLFGGVASSSSCSPSSSSSSSAASSLHTPLDVPEPYLSIEASQVGHEKRLDPQSPVSRVSFTLPTHAITTCFAIFVMVSGTQHFIMSHCVTSLVALAFMWIAISLWLAYLESDSNDIDNVDPASESSSSSCSSARFPSHLAILSASCLIPFIVTFVEIYSIIAVTWLQQSYKAALDYSTYNTIGTFILITITCGELSIQMCRSQFQSEKRYGMGKSGMWWWRAFGATSSLTLYAVLYASMQFEMKQTVFTAALYLLLKLLACGVWIVMTGIIGVVAYSVFVAKLNRIAFSNSISNSGDASSSLRTALLSQSAGGAADHTPVATELEWESRLTHRSKSNSSSYRYVD